MPIVSMASVSVKMVSKLIAQFVMILMNVLVIRVDNFQFVPTQLVVFNANASLDILELHQEYFVKVQSCWFFFLFFHDILIVKHVSWWISGTANHFFFPILAPCDDVKCGEHAYCKPDGQEAYCICEEGWTFNPSDIAAGCIGTL